MCGRHVASDNTRFARGKGRTIAPSISLKRFTTTKNVKYFAKVYECGTHK